MPNLPTISLINDPSHQLKRVNLIGLGEPTYFSGYISGRVYPTWKHGESTAAFPSAANVYWHPFTVPAPIIPVSIGPIVSTLGSGSGAKCGLWAHNPVTGRPTGIMLPGSGSNTELDTTSTGYKANTTTIALVPGVIYWFGLIAKATLPQFASVTGLNYYMTSLLGLANTGVPTAINGVATAFTYANDLTAFDPSTVTNVDYGAGGVPIGFLLAP